MKLHRPLRPLAAFAFAMLIASCTEQPAGLSNITLLQVRPQLTAAGGSALPINRIVISARLVSSPIVIGSVDRMVDPSATSWELPLELTLSGTAARDVVLNVELLHVDENGQTVEWSGTKTITVIPGLQGVVSDITLAQSPAAVASITVTPGTVPLIVGNSIAVTAEVFDGQHNRLTRQVAWSSSDTAVAIVSSTGLITGKKPGSATIIARVDQKSGTATVTVYAPVPSGVVKVSGDTQSMNITKTAGRPMVVRAVDQFGVAISGLQVQWVVTSGGGAVSPATSTSDAAGVAQAIYTAGTSVGTATVEARANGLTGSPVAFTATVLPQAPVATITLAPATRTLAGGDTVRLVPTAQDASGNTLINVIYAWSSSDTTIATVSQTGLVTARRPGTATISAASNGKTGSSTITVVVGAARTISLYSGNNQVAHTGAHLPANNIVKVTDAAGNGVAGVDVTFTVIGGGGSVTPTTARTDTAGLAGTNWALGPTQGNQFMQASAVGLTGTPLLFTATGTGDVGVRRNWVGGNAASPDNWAIAGNWSPAGVPSALDTAFVAPSTRPPRLQANAEVGALIIQPNAMVDNGGYELSVHSLLNNSGSATGPGHFVLTGPNALVHGAFSNLFIMGSATATSVISTTGSMILGENAVFTLAGFTLNIAEELEVTGVLVLANATDAVNTRDIVFANTNETGKLTAGTIRVSGNFITGCYNDTEFTPTGTKVVMNGTAPQLILICSTPTGNRFFDLNILAGSTVTTDDVVYIDTMLVSGTLNVGPPAIIDVKDLTISMNGVLNNNGITRTNLPYHSTGTVNGHPVIQR